MTVDLPAGSGPGKGRSLPIAHLRSALVLLVIVQHAVLAYHPYAPPPGETWDAAPMMWRAFPVVDSARAAGLDLLVGFNDTFFMALFFFLAGLFTWRGLKAKGVSRYLRDRSLRLGLPFVVCAAVLAPLAYFPSYLQNGGEADLGSFARVWTSLGVWPAGPAWFLWVLLAFSLAAAGGTALAPRWGERLGEILGRLGERPLAFFALFAGASVLVYVPMASVFNPMIWFEWGPFTVQTSRLLLYCLYFVFGIGVGAAGVDRGLLAPDGRLARRWPAWVAAGLLTFFVLMAVAVAVFAQMAEGAVDPGLVLTANFLFAISSAASSLMFLALFVRFGQRGGAIGRSLARNAFGIYLVHYVFVTWVQYSLLGVEAGGLAKAAMAVVGGILLSWAGSSLVRRVPGVARVI